MLEMLVLDINLNILECKCGIHSIEKNSIEY